MITVLALSAFSNYLRNDVLNVEPIHSYILGDTQYTWSVENFQLVRKHVVEQDEALKAAGVPYWLVFLCSREKIEVSPIQPRHFSKIWANTITEEDAARYQYRMAHLDFKMNIYSNSIKILEDVEELILTTHVDKPLEINVPGLFPDPAKPMSINVADFKVDALQKGDSSKIGTIVYLQCSGSLDYPLALSREVLPLILTEILTIGFAVSAD